MALSDIRKAALELYTPPFRHEHGYIRDANGQVVADDAGSEAVGLIASRIRGWGRIQYLDNPKGRAAALQDETAEILVEALNAYWAPAEVRKDDEALIRQLVDAINAELSEDWGCNSYHPELYTALAVGRARLEGKP